MGKTKLSLQPPSNVNELLAKDVREKLGREQCELERRLQNLSDLSVHHFDCDSSTILT